MGDRVLIVAHAGDNDIAPAIYGHWLGFEAPGLLRQAGDAGIIRQDDPSYAAARICGFLHEQDNRSTTGLGIVNPPTDLTDETLSSFSQGDAGVVAVDVRDGSIRYVGGYLGREGDDTETVSTVKLAA